MHMRALSFVLCAAVLAGMAAVPPPASAQGSLAAPAVASEPRVRLLRSWVEEVKVDGREETRQVKIFFDYDQGLARQVVRDAAGAVIEDAIIQGAPHATEEEIAEAIGIVRADRVLGGMLTRVNAVPDGGFLLQEPAGKACGPRTRCLHVFWFSPDRIGLVRWTVVDLVKQTIAYRHYTPPDYTEATEGVSK